MSEDYSKYTTDYLLKMKSAIQAELDRRNIETDSLIENSTVYNDENISILLDHTTINDNIFKANFLISCSDNISCIVIPNINENIISSVDGFEALSIMKTIGAGHVFQYSKQGQDITCAFEWDINTIYDTSFIPPTIPIELNLQQMQIISIPVKLVSFPKIAGFTIVEFNGDWSAQTNDLITGNMNPDEYFKSFITILNIQFITQP